MKRATILALILCIGVSATLLLGCGTEEANPPLTSPAKSIEYVPKASDPSRISCLSGCVTEATECMGNVLSAFSECMSNASGAVQEDLCNIVYQNSVIACYDALWTCQQQCPLDDDGERELADDVGDTDPPIVHIQPSDRLKDQ